MAGYHACFTTESGRVACWGGNHVGQLGDGALARRARPTFVPGLEHVVDLAAGSGHTCALTGDGGVWCWGANHMSQTGDPIDTITVAAMRVRGLPSDVSRVFAGGERSCALTRGGSLYCWGKPQGLDGMQRGVATPVLVEERTDVQDVTIDWWGACGVRASGALRCWNATFGRGQQAAARDIETGVMPAEVVLLQPNIAAVLDDGGEAHLLDVTRGAPLTEEREDFRAFTSGQYVHVAGGGPRLCALDTDGKLSCRGNSMLVDSALGAVAELASSSAFVCALVSGDDVRCLGEGDMGQLGDGTRANRDSAVAVLAPVDATPTPAIRVEASVTPEASCAAPTPEPSRQAVVGGPTAEPERPELCGNGQRDSWQGLPICAPCAAGSQHCPCSTPTYNEDCDRTDLGGATCASRGFVAGTLSCSASCSLDVSRCDACSGTPDVACGSLPITAVPTTPATFVAAASAAGLGMAWSESGACGMRFGLVSARLQPIGSVATFGGADETAIALVAIGTGFVVVSQLGDGTVLRSVDSRGRVNRRIDLGAGRPLFAVGGRDGAIVVGLSRALASDEAGFGAAQLILVSVRVDTAAIGFARVVTTAGDQDVSSARGLTLGERTAVQTGRGIVIVDRAGEVVSREAFVTTDFVMTGRSGELVHAGFDGQTVSIAGIGSDEHVSVPLAARSAYLMAVGPSALLFSRDGRLSLVDVRGDGAPRDFGRAPVLSAARVVEAGSAGTFVVWIGGRGLSFARLAARSAEAGAQ